MVHGAGLDGSLLLLTPPPRPCPGAKSSSRGRNGTFPEGGGCNKQFWLSPPAAAALFRHCPTKPRRDLRQSYVGYLERFLHALSQAAHDVRVPPVRAVGAPCVVRYVEWEWWSQGERTDGSSTVVMQQERTGDNQRAPPPPGERRNRLPKPKTVKQTRFVS